jgi:hypothetical protein
MFSHQDSASMASATVFDMPTFVFEIQNYPEDLGFFFLIQNCSNNVRENKNPESMHRMSQ